MHEKMHYACLGQFTEKHLIMHACSMQYGAPSEIEKSEILNFKAFLSHTPFQDVK
jgi:hypothetical protein